MKGKLMHTFGNLLSPLGASDKDISTSCCTDVTNQC